MSFMDRIRGQFKERKEKAKEKSVYQTAYEKEKKLVQEEREKQRIERAKIKARRDVRNPLFRRFAKKAGALTLKVIDSAAIQIGKQVKEKKKEIYLVEKARRKAGFKEITKIVAKQEREAIRASPPAILRGRQSPVNLFGNKDMNPLNLGSNMNPLGSSKQKENLLSNFNPLGSSSGSSGKKSKKYNLLDGL